ncbi:MAG: nuclear transport factor 2 family protein [Acidobacteria bacterium]|nr:nuclear transport factor 2 family protein [Acidobacteriota bacterium]
MRKLFAAVSITLALAAAAVAQNTNSSTTAPPRTARPSNANTAATPAPPQGESQPPDPAAARSRARRAASASTPAGSAASQAVRAVFDNLIKGIERSDVDAVMALYWNSPQLVIFNNNGTVTRGWDQVKSNRASSYPEAKEVKIDARDVRVQTLGRDGAVVTCLWRQSQEYRGTPETAAGRLTVVFRLVNNGWKIVHTHSSPEAPDPSRLLPSEQAAPPARDTAAPPPPPR